MKIVLRYSNLLAGFVTGGAAWLVARTLDALAAGAPLPNFTTMILEAGWAGLVLGVCSPPRFRSLAARYTSFVSTTIGFVVILIPMMIFASDVPARALVLFYALALVSLTLLFRKSIASPTSTRISDYLDTMPHSIFVFAALSMIVWVPFLLASNQAFIAERIARWSFGFLMLGTTGAILAQIELPERFKHLARRFADVALIVVLLAVAYWLGETSRISPAVVFYTDVQPNILESRVGDGDVIISDSANLRLGSIRNVGAHLDLDPDTRGTALWDDLVRALADKRHVFWVGVPNESRDTQKFLASFLKTNGCLNKVVNNKLSVREYELRAPFTRPSTITPLTIDWQEIRLTGAAFDLRVCSHDAIAVALRWQLAQPSQAPLKLSLFVLDSKGRQIQTQDFFIADSVQRQTHQWTNGDTVIADYLALIPFGTPPGNYSLAVAVYLANAPQRLRIANATGIASESPEYAVLGFFQIDRPNDLQTDPYQTISELALLPAGIELRDGLRLDAYSIDRSSMMPGEDLSVIARWQSMREALPKYQVRARLVRDTQTIIETTRAPVDDTYPTDQWRAGESVLDRFELRVPPATAGGMARLEIGIAGGKWVYLADVDVKQIDHVFTLPAPICPVRATFVGVGELVGCEARRASIAANDRLQMQLAWRALAQPSIDRNYVAFVQLIASDGRLIAQSDAIPASGQRPTRGWIAGEIIQDRHELEWVDQNYRGAARWIIGLYDSTTLERVAVVGIGDSFVTLPVSVQIIAPR